MTTRADHGLFAGSENFIRMKTPEQVALAVLTALVILMSLILATAKKPK